MSLYSVRVTLIHMISLSDILNPPSTLTVGEVILISYILGLLHGATPDEHTWPITFSYAIGEYSTRRGMKAGFLFSLGFTVQRMLLTTLGFIGLAYIYQKYNLDGPVYVIVGLVMAIAGSYVLKGKYIHIPIDLAIGGKSHHTEKAIRIPLNEEIEGKIPLKMTIIHGLIAGFGFGAYATIITFVLAPRMPSIVYAPIPGLMFGLGTMSMQVIFGAIFASIMKIKKITEEQIAKVASRTAGRTLYYGGIVFLLAGLLIILIPPIDNIALPTGNPIPNLDAINVGFILVVTIVGVIGVTSLISSYREIKKLSKT